MSEAAEPFVDVDEIYQSRHGRQEHPYQFRTRFQQSLLTDDEKEVVDGITDPDEAFAALYPDYVSLHQFREKFWARDDAGLTIIEDDDADAD